MNKKNSKKGEKIIILLLILAILVLITIGLISFISFSDSDNNHGSENNDYVKLKTTDNLVNELLSLTGNDDNNFLINTTYGNMFYTKEKFEASDLDINSKLLLAYLTLEREQLSSDNNLVIIKEEDLKNQYNKIFGDNSYKPQDISYTCPSLINYNKEKQRYEYSDFCGGDVSSGYKNKILEVRKYNNKIEVYEKVAFYLLNESNEKVTYWSNNDYSDILVELNMNEEFNIDNYLEELKTYKYTFIKNGDSYYFKSIELIKE